MYFCKICEEELSKNAPFCNNCGHVMEEGDLIESDTNLNEEISQAIRFCKTKELNAAKIFLTNFLKDNPDNIKALTNLGIVLFDLDEMEDSLECFNRILELDENNIPALSYKLKLDDFLDTGFNHYDLSKKILDLDPGNFFALADMYGEDSKKGFLDSFIYYKSSNLDSKESLLLKADTYESFGLFEDAEEVYLNLLEDDSENVLILNSLSEVYVKLEKYEEALKYNDKVLSIDSTNKKALHFKSTILSYLGKSEESLECNKEFLKQYPDDAHGIFNRVLCLRDLGRNSEACKDIKYLKENKIDELAKTSDVYTFYEILVDYYVAEKDYDNAIKYLKNFLTSDLRFLGAILEYGYDFDIPDFSLRVCDMILDYDPCNIPALECKLSYFVSSHQPEKGIKISNQLLELDSSNTDFLISKASALLALNKYGESVRISKRILKLDKDNEEALQIICCALMQDGKGREADKYYRKLKRLEN